MLGTRHFGIFVSSEEEVIGGGWGGNKVKGQELTGAKQKISVKGL